jgi:hypothetical protein
MSPGKIILKVARVDVLESVGENSAQDFENISQVNVGG